MKITHIHIVATDCGNSVIRLHNFMRKHGIDSKVVVPNSTIKDINIISFNWLKFKLFILKRLIEKKFIYKKRNFTFNYPMVNNFIHKIPEVKNADIIYLHWTQGGFLGLKSLKKILQLGKPTILSCRDSWYLTGGCNIPYDCTKMKTHCSNCQFINGEKIKDYSYNLFDKKEKLYAQFSNISILAPSSWMTESARTSFLTQRFQCFTIPNIVGEAYTSEQKDKKSLREEYNIDMDKIILLFGALSPISNPNKGWEYFVQAINKLKNASEYDIELLVFGEEKIDIAQYLPYKTHNLGRINSEKKLAMIYSLSDIYITTSLSESFGNTLLESSFCKTPIVAFNYGGMKDIIEHKKNGYLAEYKNSEDIANGIIYCLDHNIKGYPLTKMHPENILNEHIKMIKKISNVNQ